MRKIKKINGFLVVKFNDREKREYEGTALGEYGVIDAEVYTGNLDIDRGAMEYDDADTLEVAVELARGLESEEDITDEPPTYTAAVETNESYTEEAVEPAALIEGWTRRLATQVKSKHYPDTDPRTAAHELYGFKMALRQIGFLPESEVITDPDTFGAGQLDGPKLMPEDIEPQENKKVIQACVGVTCTKLSSPWTVYLSTLIAAHYCCRPYRSSVHGSKVSEIGFIGMEDDFKLCKLAFLYAYDCIASRCRQIRNQKEYPAKTLREMCLMAGASAAVCLPLSKSRRPSIRNGAWSWSCRKRSRTPFPK